MTHAELPPGADPWKMASVTPEFLEALRRRRRIQAGEILSFLKNELSGRRLLDYGCGQGAFVKFLLENGVDASGCDISDTNVDHSTLGERFIQLSAPWGMPSQTDFQIVSLLDVIEHAEKPQEIVAQLRQFGAEYVLVKVPMLHGPIGKLAQLFAGVGKVGLLERLLLVGEISPHYSFFTSAGLESLFAAEGYGLVKAARIADVGDELPERMRGKEGEPTIPVKQLLGKAIGSGLAAIAPAWSDTRVFLFRRQVQSEKMTTRRAA